MKKETNILEEAAQQLGRFGKVTMETAAPEQTGRMTLHEAPANYVTARQPARTLTFEKNGVTNRYLAIIEPRITTANAGLIAHQMQERTHDIPALLMTNYVAPGVADALRELRVQFIDTAGNTYMDGNGVFVMVRGMKKTTAKNMQIHHDQNVNRTGMHQPVLRGTGKHPAPEKHGTTELFGWAGLKVVFVLLCAPDLLHATYRQIATAAGTALGTIAGVMDELKRRGYLLELKNREPRLIHRKQLAERWAIEYAERLRGKLLLGFYEAGMDIDTDTVQKAGAFAGGETAAWELNRYLIPTEHTVYVQEGKNKTMVALRLREVQDGTVELREQFWNFDYPERARGLVPPLLIYADLMAAGDPRTIETARRIYDEYLAGRFGED